MQHMTMIWNKMCVVVMLRPEDVPDGGGDDRESALEAAVKDAASAQKVPGTMYGRMRVRSTDDEFFAWNIGHPDLLRELLLRRRGKRLGFRAYFRYCGGMTAVIEEEGFFLDF